LLRIIMNLIDLHDMKGVLELGQCCKQFRSAVVSVLHKYEAVHFSSRRINNLEENTFIGNFKQMYFQSRIEIGLGVYYDERWMCSNRDNFIGMTKKIKEWKPIAQMCESGNHVPFTDDLLSFFNQIIHRGDFIISSFIDVPIFPLKLSLEVQEDRSWVFRNSELTAVSSRRVWDKQIVEYYKNRMKKNSSISFFNSIRHFKGFNFYNEGIDNLSTLQFHKHLQDYIPTVILLSPDQYYKSSGVVLDGHHKIQAAVEIGSPVRVIMLHHREWDINIPWKEESIYDDDFIDDDFR